MVQVLNRKESTIARRSPEYIRCSDDKPSKPHDLPFSKLCKIDITSETLHKLKESLHNSIKTCTLFYSYITVENNSLKWECHISAIFLWHVAPPTVLARGNLLIHCLLTFFQNLITSTSSKSEAKASAFKVSSFFLHHLSTYLKLALDNYIFLKNITLSWFGCIHPQQKNLSCLEMSRFNILVPPGDNFLALITRMGNIGFCSLIKTRHQFAMQIIYISMMLDQVTINIIAGQ